jgi:hypothetical protein
MVSVYVPDNYRYGEFNVRPVSNVNESQTNLSLFSKGTLRECAHFTQALPFADTPLEPSFAPQQQRQMVMSQMSNFQTNPVFVQQEKVPINLTIC